MEALTICHVTDLSKTVEVPGIEQGIFNGFPPVEFDHRPKLVQAATGGDALDYRGTVLN